MVPERTSAAPSLAAERTFYSSDLFPGEGSSQQPCFPCGVCSLLHDWFGESISEGFGSLYCTYYWSFLIIDILDRRKGVTHVYYSIV
jgi:hypothetical protein